MFAGLLAVVREMEASKNKLQLIVEELTPSRPQALDDVFAGDKIRLHKKWTDHRMSGKWNSTGRKPVMVGTDARGFWLPPDGVGALKAAVGAGKRLTTKNVIAISLMPAGTDPLGFRHPPNGWLYGTRLLMGGGREMTEPSGTNQRSFWGPSDLAAARQAGHLELSKIVGAVARTDVRWFRQPPDPMEVGGNCQFSKTMGRECGSQIDAGFQYSFEPSHCTGNALPQTLPTIPF